MTNTELTYLHHRIVAALKKKTNQYRDNGHQATVEDLADAIIDGFQIQVETRTIDLGDGCEPTILYRYLSDWIAK